MKNLMNSIVIGMLGALALFAGSAGAGTVTYYHNDLAGSPVAATNAAGAVIWRETYRPYGERLTNAPAATHNKVWFTSRHQDPGTGLVYMGARYYDPVVGRFVSMDPVGFDETNLHSHNRYAYANNNPYKYVDPDGQIPVPIIVAAIWAGARALASRAATVALTRGPQASITAGEVLAGDAMGAGGIAIATTTGVKAVGNAAEGVAHAIAGGGAKTGNISTDDMKRIQNAVDRTNIEVNVVGRRASGTAGPMSDWDYILRGGTSSERHSIKSSLPEGPRGLGEPRNQDFLKGPIDKDKPHITFTPQR